jgi:hypothetical protein
VFLQGDVPASLDYAVLCDAEWVSRQGHVRGWLGDECVELTAVRAEDGTWTLNGRVVPALEHCADLDLGFTPATNLLPLRRLALEVGEAAEITSAWLDVEAGALEPLRQHYERRTQDTYWYEAPRFDYAAMLDVASSGFVRLYPDLWEMEA